MPLATLLFLLVPAGAVEPPAEAELPASIAGGSRTAETSSNEIVVVGGRLTGEVSGSIEATQSFDSAALSGLGASNLADILNQLTAQTGGSQGRSGGGPIVLVNGRRIGSFDEVRNLPPESIQRIDILPEEAALRLGYAANSKPVNVVLKSSYRAATGELEDRVTTRGLRNDFNTELNAVDIAGDNRTTFNLQYQIGDAITEAKRNVERPVDAKAASVGGLVSNPLGGFIPSTSALILAVPPTGRRLGDFLTIPVADTTGAFHTLVPSTRQLTADGVFARALGGEKTLTLNGKFDRLIADDLLGPAILDTQIPLGTGNPFAAPVRLRRSLTDWPSVNRRTATNNIHLGAMLAGYGRWQWSVAFNFDKIDQERRRSGGVDSSLFQSAVNVGGVPDPFGVPLISQLLPRLESRSSSHDQLYSADLFTSGELFALGDGAVNLSLRGSLGREAISAEQSGFITKLVREHAGGQASLDIPLLSGDSAIGSLDAGINASADHFSDAGNTTSFGGTLNWKPAKTVSVLLAASRDQQVPGVSQLGATVETTPDAAFYDYSSGRSLIVSRIDGGNPTLGADKRKIFKAELGWKPIKGLNATAAYTVLDDQGALFGFPGITSAVSSALPTRILPDVTGAIVAIDARPFNAEREKRQELKLSLSFSKSFKQGAGPKVPGGGGFGGGHAFGAQGSMLQFSLTDTIRLEDQLQLAAGAPPIDLIGANKLGDGLRIPRQRIEAQFSGTHHGFGLRSNAVWTSGGAAGVGEAGQLNFDDRFAINMRLFYYPASNEKMAARMPWLKGVRLLFVIDNLFDSYQHVADRTGRTPFAFQRGLLDPIGRTFRISIRKTID
jgi:iron complex outermembrane recepter protein